MRRTAFTEEQVARALRQPEAGTPSMQDGRRRSVRLPRLCDHVGTDDTRAAEVLEGRPQLSGRIGRAHADARWNRRGGRRHERPE